MDEHTGFGTHGPRDRRRRGAPDRRERPRPRDLAAALRAGPRRPGPTCCGCRTPRTGSASPPCRRARRARSRSCRVRSSATTARSRPGSTPRRWRWRRHRRTSASFVLIGRESGADARARWTGCPNVHRIGEVPYERLPEHLAAFDVCTIPFQRTPLTEATNPVKLYEYFATGKPVVARRLPEIEPFADVVELYDSAGAIRRGPRARPRRAGPTRKRWSPGAGRSPARTPGRSATETLRERLEATAAAALPATRCRREREARSRRPPPRSPSPACQGDPPPRAASSPSSPRASRSCATRSRRASGSWRRPSAALRGEIARVNAELARIAAESDAAAAAPRGRARGARALGPVAAGPAAQAGAGARRTPSPRRATPWAGPPRRARRSSRSAAALIPRAARALDAPRRSRPSASPRSWSGWIPAAVPRRPTRSRRGPRGRYDVVVFSIIDWDFRFQRPQQLATQFGRHGHRVFYLSTTQFLAPDEPVRPGTSRARPRTWGSCASAPAAPLDVYRGALDAADLDVLVEAFEALAPGPRDGRRRLPGRRSRSGRRSPSACASGWAGGSSTTAWTSGRTSRASAPRSCRARRRWCGAPTRRSCRPTGCEEKWKGDRAAADPGQERHRRRALPRALRAQRRCRCRRRVRVRHPVIGYYGALASWVDVPLLEKIVRRHPDATIVLAGGHFDVDLSTVSKAPNVRLLGPAALRRDAAAPLELRRLRHSRSWSTTSPRPPTRSSSTSTSTAASRWSRRR